jgi:ribosomal protein S12 methylthiotransferase accessory factor
VLFGGVAYRHAPIDGDEVARALARFGRYTSSVGFAAGATWGDSVLHAACELVEHDAVSMFLLESVLTARRVPNVVLPECLVPPELVRSVSDSVGVDPVLVDVSHDPGVPAFVALPADRRTAMTPMGAGASPNRMYAAVRALCELQQIVVASQRDGRWKARNRDMVLRLSPWPHLLQVLNLDMKLPPPVDVPARSGAGTSGVVEDDLERVLAGIEPFGGVFSMPVTPPDSLMTVTYSVAPGLEQFDLTRGGWPVLPTARGMAAFSPKTSTAARGGA